MIMEGSTVPLRYHHNTHLGVVRLPKRYNVNQNGSDEQEYLSDSLDDRLRDMTQAITWIKQEMVRHLVIYKVSFLIIIQTRLSYLPDRPLKVIFNLFIIFFFSWK